MTIVLSLILAAVALALVGMIIVQAARGTVELLSIRNFFLVGFLLFQLWSAILSLGFGFWEKVRVQNPEQSGLIFTVCSIVFLALFLAAFHGGRPASRLAAKIGKNYATPGTTSMLTLGAVFLAVGMVFRVVLVLVHVPVVAPLADMVGGALLSASAGMAAWAWAPHLRNPMVALAAVAIILLALVGVLANATFGRRDIVGVCAAALWGLYFGRWRYLGTMPTLWRLTIMATPGLLVLVAFTAIRSPDERQSSLGQVIQRMFSANLRYGFADVTSGQLAAANSMWLIENRPGPAGYDTLHSVKYFTTQIIPRAIFPDKPIGLGLTLPDEMLMRRVAQTFNVGPGMIGHIFNDNPYIALWLYPLIFGLAMRFLDDLAKLHPANPFVVLPVGTALGHLTGIPRGEVGLFSFRLAMSVIVCMIGMWLICRIMLALGWRISYDAPAELAAHGTGDDEGSDQPLDADQDRDEYGYADEAYGGYAESTDDGERAGYGHEGVAYERGSPSGSPSGRS